MSDFTADDVKRFVINESASLETLVGEFGDHFDHWTLRRLRRDALAAAAVEEVEESDVISSVPLGTLRKTTQLALQAGFFRPVQVELPKVRVPKPIFESVGKTYFLYSDIHAPVHDPVALDVALQVATSLRLDGAYQLGDGWDVHALSRHVPNPERPYRWVTEREETVKVQAGVAAVFDSMGVEQKYVPGNHDVRVTRWVEAHAPQLAGCFSMEQLLGIDTLPFEVCHAGITFPELNLQMIHGERLSKHAGQSAMKHVEHSGISTVMGHCHRAARVHVTKAQQEMTGAHPLMGVELGCLCDLDADYLTDTANWQQAVGVLTVSGDDYDIELVKIHRGRALFRGKVFTSGV